jgi:hypothetical protein
MMSSPSNKPLDWSFTYYMGYFARKVKYGA